MEESDRVELDGRPWLGAAARVRPSAQAAGHRDDRPRSAGPPDRRRHLVPREPRVVPVGRLDAYTTGALLLTNDGPLAHRLAHPRYGVEKVYEAEVEGEPDDAALDALRAGVELDDGRTVPRASAASRRRGSSSSSTRAATTRCAACSKPSATRSSAFIAVAMLGYRGGAGARPWRALEPSEVERLRLL